MRTVPLTPGEGLKKPYCPSVGCFWTEMRLIPYPGPRSTALRPKALGLVHWGPALRRRPGGCEGRGDSERVC